MKALALQHKLTPHLDCLRVRRRISLSFYGNEVSPKVTDLQVTW